MWMLREITMKSFKNLKGWMNRKIFGVIYLEIFWWLSWQSTWCTSGTWCVVCGYMMYRGTGCARRRTWCDVALECASVLGYSTWCTIGHVVHLARQRYCNGCDYKAGTLLKCWQWHCLRFELYLCKGTWLLGKMVNNVIYVFECHM